MNWSPPPLMAQPRPKRILELNSNKDLIYRILKVNFNDNSITIYYFNEKFIYCKQYIKRKKDINPKILTIPENKHCLQTKTSPILPTKIDDIAIRHGIFNATLNQLKPGDNLSKLITIYNQHVNDKIKPYRTEITAQNRKERKLKREQNLKQHHNSKQKYSKTKQLPPIQTLDDFITYIEKPTIERMTDNKNPKTFDFVRLYISINTRCPNPKAFAQKYLKEIKQIALDKIKNCRDYQHYDIPVNYLKLVECTLTHQSQIMFLYELKQPT